jgi:hypothetical protein
VKRKQNSAEKVKRKLTVWQYQYDNGEAGMLHERKGVWRGEKRIWSDIAYFPNENEAQKHVKDLCRKNGISEEKCMGGVRTFSSGIEHLLPGGGILKTQAAPTALMQMMNSCGTDEEGRRTMVQLLSAGLAGYLFRLCSERGLLSVSEPVNYLTAPRITCSAADGATDALRLIMQSIGLDTEEVLTAHADEGSVESCLPVYLPPVGNERRIIDCAYAQVCKGKQDKAGDEKYYGEVLAAQYRDTVVGVNTAFFTARDVKDFVRRNRWATIIQLGDKRGIVEPIRINGKILARAWQSDGWDAIAVQGLIRDFLLWMTADLFGEDRKGVCSKEMALKDACDRANQRISENNQKRGTPKHKGLQRLWLETQMMVLRELESYLFDMGFWTRKEGQNTLNGWLHTLLPAVYSPPIDNLPVDDPKHLLNYEADSQMLFKNLLTAMVTPGNYKYFMAVPVKGEFPMKKADGTDIWGYVRGFQVTGKDGHRYRVPTLQIREDVLTEVAAMLMPIECDWLTVIKTVREQQPDYLVGKSRNVRLPVDGESRLCATLVLSVEKLLWLSEEAQNILLDLITLIALQK